MRKTAIAIWSSIQNQFRLADIGDRVLYPPLREVQKIDNFRRLLQANQQPVVYSCVYKEEKPEHVTRGFGFPDRTFPQLYSAD